MSKWLITCITLVFLISEIALHINQVIGFVSYIILLTGLILGLGFEKEEEYKTLFFLMILPVVRITGLLVDIPAFWKIMLIYYSLAFLAIFYAYSFKIDVGFKTKKIAFLPVAILVGLGLGYVCQKVTGISLESNIIILISIIAFTEELFFRGLIQNSLSEKGVIFSIVISSVLYGIFSLELGWIFALFAFGLAILSSVSYKTTSNLFLSIAINLGFQAALVLLL